MILPWGDFSDFFDYKKEEVSAYRKIPIKKFTHPKDSIKMHPIKKPVPIKNDHQLITN
jgi:hypothetical protein